LFLLAAFPPALYFWVKKSQLGDSLRMPVIFAEQMGCHLSPQKINHLNLTQPSQVDVMF